MARSASQTYTIVHSDRFNSARKDTPLDMLLIAIVTKNTLRVKRVVNVSLDWTHKFTTYSYKILYTDQLNI